MSNAEHRTLKARGKTQNAESSEPTAKDREIKTVFHNICARGQNPHLENPPDRRLAFELSAYGVWRSAWSVR
jgi:hypothetical protein